MSGAGRPEPVLFLESRLHHGGDVQVLLDMLAALDPAQFEAHVACVPGGAVTAQRSNLPPEVRLHPLDFGYGESGPGRVRSLVATVRELRRLVREQGIRVVHSNNTRRTLTAAVLLKAAAPRRVRLVYHAHCEPQHTAAHRAALRLSTQVWCVSEFVRSEYLRLGVPDHKLVMMPNGAQFRAVEGGAAVREQWGVPEDAPLAVLVGRLSPVKGQHLAVAALGQSSVPAGTVLALVGDDSIEDRNEGYREHLLDLARDLGVRDQLVLAGFRPDPGPCYAAADVIVIPSHREPFGLVALEAAAAGRPIVATRSGGLIEVLGDVAGLPLVAEDPEALAEGMARAIHGQQDPPPSVVRDRLAARYSMTAFASRLSDALEALAERGPRAKVRHGAQ